MITNSSLPAPSSPSHQTTALTLPLSALHIPSLPLDPASIEDFLRAFLLPETSRAQAPSQTRPQPHLLRRPDLQSRFVTRELDEVLVLVCSHGGRDARCGVLGPVLIREFEGVLAREGVRVLTEAEAEAEAEAEEKGEEPGLTARVAGISHVGGHKFAGNVIVYLPRGMRGNGLAGKGVWYGRVEPGHVEGIVRETVLGGRVIRELFRGGVGPGGEMLRL
ncbi:Actin patches distal protein 1 [Sphaceloma murrayae]|uniref:Altered inheritance of mitochondria protein 32 n=1 Tax=Sphaceloma murrayae TaxID=2082308 RepID=A0A2K1QGX7_9PEZI|nr:Actin patches distal protein 1 [Sphaceloma murrayae]